MTVQEKHLEIFKGFETLLSSISVENVIIQSLMNNSVGIFCNGAESGVCHDHDGRAGRPYTSSHRRWSSSSNNSLPGLCSRLLYTGRHLTSTGVYVLAYGSHLLHHYSLHVLAPHDLFYLQLE